jgi:hypothetical protein
MFGRIFFVLLICSTGIHAFAPSSHTQGMINFKLSRRVPSTTTAIQATWSNGQAIKEYQDFLASGKQEIDMASDGPSLIVKSASSNASNLMVEALTSIGNEFDAVITPGAAMPTMLGDRESFPIYITIPPMELDEFLKNLPDDWKPRREDFIFLSGGKQYGVIEPILKTYGMARDSMTQLLCGGFTTPGYPKVPMDLSCNIGLDTNGEDKIAGETAVCGKWAGAVRERFESRGIPVKVGFYREWRRWMWERAAFDAVFNLVGAVRREPTSIKDVALYYDQEASDMLWQITGNLRGWLAVTVTYGFEERLFNWAESRFDKVPCEIPEEMYPYMFPAPIDKGNMLIEYVNYAKSELGLLQNAQLPKCSTVPSAMRQGNLRSDGVI